MAATSLKLSSKKGADGKCQIIVKLTISRSQRPCFKSGVFVNPEWFKVVQETKHGFVFGIVPPKKGRFNMLEVKDAKEAETRLTEYVNRLTAICNSLESLGKDINHENIDEILSLTRDTPATAISPSFLKEALFAKKGEKNEDGNAIHGMTKALSIELAQYNIMVNSVSPGFTMTELTKTTNTKEQLVELAGRVAAHRLADPQEQANVVAFLCSDQNSYMTGQNLIVDGGYTNE